MTRTAFHLTQKQITAGVLKRLKKYDKLNFLERYAMFMGTAQVLEISLKQLTHRRYKIQFENIERRTLGGMAKLLREHGLRQDFLYLLDSVVNYRNHIAHDLLASQFMLISLGLGHARFERRVMERGIYELEQLCFLYEWTEKHKAWGRSHRTSSTAFPTDAGNAET